MAQDRKHEAPDTLDELASIGERIAQWIGANPALVLAGAALILLTAASVGGYRAWTASRSERASAALSTLRTDYVVAMGGAVTDTEVPEPANPETGRTVRTDFADRYLTLAKEWDGTPTGGLALLEAGGLFDQLGNHDRAQEVWTLALAATPSGSPALGILHSRIGHVQEEKGLFEDAARSYEAAAAVPGFPLVGGALADAARAWTEAGKDEPALAAWRRLRTEFPDYRVPPYVESRLAEIESKTGAPPAAQRDPSAAAPAPGAPEPANP